MAIIDFHTHNPTAEGVVTPRSFGIHPWVSDEEPSKDFDEFLTRYKESFTEAEIIGECGLDKACRSTWEGQVQIFQWQIQLSEMLNKPMVIHCVRAFNELIQMRRNHPAVPWVVHGFTGSVELQQQLWNAGLWVSYGAALIDPRRAKVRESLRLNPHPFLLETDESPCGIEAVYKAAAAIRQISVPDLQSTINRHYHSLFNQQSQP